MAALLRCRRSRDINEAVSPRRGGYFCFLSVARQIIFLRWFRNGQGVSSIENDASRAYDHNSQQILKTITSHQWLRSPMYENWQLNFFYNLLYLSILVDRSVISYCHILFFLIEGATRGLYSRLSAACSPESKVS